MISTNFNRLLVITDIPLTDSSEVYLPTSASSSLKKIFRILNFTTER